jgi:hypothetical protein
MAALVWPPRRGLGRGLSGASAKTLDKGARAWRGPVALPKTPPTLEGRRLVLVLLLSLAYRQSIGGHADEHRGREGLESAAAPPLIPSSTPSRKEIRCAPGWS